MVVAGASGRDGSVVVSSPSTGACRSGVAGAGACRPGVAAAASRMTGTSTVGVVAAGVSRDASGSLRASIVGCGGHGADGQLAWAGGGLAGLEGRGPLAPGVPLGPDGQSAGIVAVGAECPGTRTRPPSLGPGGSGIAGHGRASAGVSRARLRRQLRNRRKDNTKPADVDMLLSP
jgi:hypothetical protein